ncbi:UNVERIFIED_ORG: hypothetical protein GGR78_003593 [Xanthomonas campestris]
MTEIFSKKLFGGLGNGHDVPSDWEGRETWRPPGESFFTVYEQRAFWHGGDRIVVWTDIDMPEPMFKMAQWWHREMYRGDLVEAQRTLLRESMAAAASYTNVIMVAGYAALFAFWSQGKEWLTKATLLSSGVAIALSVFMFVGWEVFGMVIRSVANLSIAEAIRNPAEFERRMGVHRDKVGGFTERFRYVWVGVMLITVLSAAAGFLILLSGFVHGLYLRFS